MHGTCGTALFLNPRNLSGSCETIAWLNPSGLVEPKEPVWNLCGTCVEPVWNLWNHCVFEPKECLEPVGPMRLTGSTGSRNSLGSRNAKVPGQRVPQAPPVPPPSVPDFRGREMLHQVQAQRLKPNCMAVGNIDPCHRIQHHESTSITPDGYPSNTKAKRGVSMITYATCKKSRLHHPKQQKPKTNQETTMKSPH